MGLRLCSELLELLDGSGPLQVAGGEGDVLVLLRRAALPSFAQAVVLPEPCRPAIRITVGPLGAKTRSRPAPPISSVSSSLTALITVWPGLSASEISSPASRSLQRGGEVLDDLEVDVGLEQREAHLAQGLVDVVLGELAPRANIGEHALQAV